MPVKKHNNKIINIKADKKEINTNNDTKDNNIYLPGFCVICWKKALYFCADCRITGYCCMSHMAKHWEQHQQLCTVVSCLREEGSIYNKSISTPDHWRFARVKFLEKIKSKLQRELQTQERDLLLFPKYCTNCYNTDYHTLEGCKTCSQVWYCRNSPEHAPRNHEMWCKNLQLFASLSKRQMEGKLFSFDMKFCESFNEKLDFKTSDNIAKIIKVVTKNHELSSVNTAMISQSATGPLTILYALKLAEYKIKANITIHLIGAEFHFEGRTLQEWEEFFLHFVPQVKELKVILIGPELKSDSNYEKLRLCEGCEEKNKTVTFEYKDGLLYHEYCKSKSYIKPNIVCAFNPGFHRTTGYNQVDTWPQTIKQAVKNRCPFVFTAYTAFEAPLDLQRVQECAAVHVIHGPKINNFASLKPDRNFISDHEAPLIYKNYYISIVSAVI